MGFLDKVSLVAKVAITVAEKDRRENDRFHYEMGRLAEAEAHRDRDVRYQPPREINYPMPRIKPGRPRFGLRPLTPLRPLRPFGGGLVETTFEFRYREAADVFVNEIVRQSFAYHVRQHLDKVEVVYTYDHVDFLFNIYEKVLDGYFG